MCDIMDQVHKLVPCKTTQSNYRLPDGDVQSFVGETFHQLLLGGDQLTAARCRGSAAARCDSDTKKERLYGLIPVSEDWHGKYRLCKVCYMYIAGLLPKICHMYSLLNFCGIVNIAVLWIKFSWIGKMLHQELLHSRTKFSIFMGTPQSTTNFILKNLGYMV